MLSHSNVRLDEKGGYDDRRGGGGYERRGGYADRGRGYGSAAGEERRQASDGGWYTRSEFESWYGGLSEWDAAGRRSGRGYADRGRGGRRESFSDETYGFDSRTQRTARPRDSRSRDRPELNEWGHDYSRAEDDTKRA